MEILLAAIGRASLHGAVAIAAVWTVCRLFPRLPASLRCGLWWLACLKLLVALVWVEPIPLAVLPAEGQEIKDIRDFKDGKVMEAPVAMVSLEPLQSLRSFDPWPLALAGLWGAGLLLQLGLTARQLAAARRTLRSAEPVGEVWVTALFAGLQERLGVRRAMLLASAEVETPQVSGVWQPRVLLPRREIGRLSPQELALTLAHELLHVRRGDLWLGWVPALAQRLFFFHPLAALAVREYALAREAACDAAVLRSLDPAPETYGRLLLRLGVTSRVPRLTAAGAAPTFQTLKRRLEMLQQSADKKRVHRGWWGLLALLALVVLIPIQIVAQAAPPEPPAAPAAPDAPDAVEPGEPAPPAEPGEPVPPAEPGEPVPSTLPTPPAPATLPVPPAPTTLPVPPAPPVVARVAHMGAPPPVPPVPPVPPAPPTPHSRMSFSDDGEPWVLLHDEKSVTMSGSGSDVRRARKYYSGKPLLWFERDGKSYVVHDQGTVARAQALFEPQTKLGDQQSGLGDHQSALGDQQSALGDRQSEIGDRMSALGDRLTDLAETRSAEAERGKIEGQMEELGRKMEELGRQQEELGRKQEVLGRQQEELGRQQEKLAAEAERQLKSLLDQAVSSGLAKVVGE
jgi:beta-lactamase regulating signal transducer with metallopeptidase domain